MATNRLPAALAVLTWSFFCMLQPGAESSCPKSPPPQGAKKWRILAVLKSTTCRPHCTGGPNSSPIYPDEISLRDGTGCMTAPKS